MKTCNICKTEKSLEDFPKLHSTKGYTEDNVQLTCWAVNLMKNTFDEENFKFWINTIHKAISSQA